MLYSSLHWSLSLCSFSPCGKSLLSQPVPILDRQRGISNCVTTAMFIVTIITFLISSLNAGTQVAAFIVFIRPALILGYLLSEKRELVNIVLQNINIVTCWAESLSVSIKVLLPDPTSYSCSVQILLNDLIVIWRASVLFPERHWVILIPSILWIGTMGEYTSFGKLFLFLNLYTCGAPHR